MEEVLPAVQRAPRAQGNEVNGGRRRAGPAGGSAGGTRDVPRMRSRSRGTTSVMAEMRRSRGPTATQMRQMSIGVILLSLVIGGVIALMDFIPAQVLVRWIPRSSRGDEVEHRWYAIQTTAGHENKVRIADPAADRAGSARPARSALIRQAWCRRRKWWRSRMARR